MELVHEATIEKGRLATKWTIFVVVFADLWILVGGRSVGAFIGMLLVVACCFLMWRGSQLARALLSVLVLLKLVGAAIALMMMTGAEGDLPRLLMAGLFVLAYVAVMAALWSRPLRLFVTWQSEQRRASKPGIH